MAKLMPTLSAKGWTEDTNEKLDYALSHFFEAEKPQTYLYPGEIADVHAILAENSHDMTDTQGALERLLSEYLNTIFDYVDVEVINISRIKKDPSNRVEMAIRLQVADHDRIIESGRMATFKFNKFSKLTELNNYGVRA